MHNATIVRLYTLDYSRLKTYLIAALFITGNIALPQLVHLMPDGGVIWLPIYLFTLIGAFKYGWKVGLLTAIFSPLLNNLFFGMPATHVLAPIMLKSVLLAAFAGIAASHFKKASLIIIASVVLAYQTAGTLGEWAMTRDLFLALQDFRMGLPGMLLQVVGGWFVINRLIYK